MPSSSLHPAPFLARDEYYDSMPLLTHMDYNGRHGMFSLRMR
jgi:hypothetical protein